MGADPPFRSQGAARGAMSLPMGNRTLSVGRPASIVHAPRLDTLTMSRIHDASGLVWTQGKAWQEDRRPIPALLKDRHSWAGKQNLLFRHF